MSMMRQDVSSSNITSKRQPRRRLENPSTAEWCARLHLAPSSMRPGLGFTLRADALERFKYVDGPEFEF